MRNKSPLTDGKVFRRALITGIGGSGGSYLAEYILKNHPETEVHGLSRWHSTTRNNLLDVSDRLKVREADLMDFASVLTVLKEVQPDVVFHLASYANVRASFITPAAVLSNNIVGTCNLFEGIRLSGLDPIIQLCSTSEVYGQVDPRDVPIKETAPMRPASPYAVSKTAQDLMGWTYFISYKMRIIRTRMFAYFNPRRMDLFATSFARQVARIEVGLQKELVHGNLDSVRTMIDVRDAMRAYWDAVVYCEPGEIYNIGGMTTLTVGQVLEKLLALADKPIPTKCDPYLLRPADVTLQIPCVEKFIKTTGWKPRFTFDESLQHLLSYWRAEARRELIEKNQIPVIVDN